MRQHLVEKWKLDEQLAGDIVERVGCGMRDVFKSVLTGFKPGETIDAAVINANIGAVIGEANQLIDSALRKLRPGEQDLKTSSPRAAVLLLDRLMTMPATSEVKTLLALGKEGAGDPLPSMSKFEDARDVLVAGNVLRDLGRNEEVAWHKRAVRTAYAEKRQTPKLTAIREGRPPVTK
jgi:hypothetical protein